MFSMCSELTPRAHVPDNRIPQLMQPWRGGVLEGMGTGGNEINTHRKVDDSKVDLEFALATEVRPSCAISKVSLL